MTWSTHKTRTAWVKAHTCLWCKQQIDVGSQYVEQRYADGNRHGQNRYHPECWEAANRQDRDELDWWNDEGCVPAYGRGSTDLAV